MAEAKEMVIELAGQTSEEYALTNLISDLERQMELAARNLQFEKAAIIRDKVKELKEVKEGGEKNDVPSRRHR